MESMLIKPVQNAGRGDLDLESHIFYETMVLLECTKNDFSISV